MTFTNERLYKNSLMAALAGTGLAVILSGLFVWYTAYSGGTLFYAESNTPMITAVDGFYYLATAQEYMTDGITPPALPWLAATLHLVTGISLAHVAFWLPAGISLALCTCFAAWGRILAFSPSTTFFAALMGGLMPAWLERSRIGWFDTDPGIALLWNACLVSTAILSLPPAVPHTVPHTTQRHHNNVSYWHKIIAGCALILCASLLAWWWKPGAALIPFCLFAWGGTFFWAQTRLERFIRLAVFALCIMATFIVLCIPENLAPSIAHLRTYALDHARLVLGLKGDIISTSIEEIATFPLTYSLENIGGHWLGGVLLLTMLACLALRHPRPLLFFIPSIIALIAGFFSERFLYLAALPLGLAAASFGQSIAVWLKQDGIRRCAINALCTGVVLISLGQWLWSWTPHGYFAREHDAVALALRRESPPHAPVWNWWDDGYFLRARTGLIPLFDGGSQDALRAYIIGRPLVSEDVRFARRWIRFFGLHGIHALQPLVRYYKDENMAWTMLDSLFAAEHTDPLIQSLPAHLQDWLFPQGPMYMYFSQRIFTISKWWSSLGRARHPKPEDVRPCVEVFKLSNFHFNPATQMLILPDAVKARGYTALTDVYETLSRPIKPPFPQENGIFAVTSPFSGWLYLVTRQGLTSLPIRLLAPGGVALEGFRPIAIDYDYAGAWEVLP